MPENIVAFTGKTTLSEPSESALEKAKRIGFDRCVVIGFDTEGKFRSSGSFSDLSEMLILAKLLERLCVDEIAMMVRPK